MRRTLSHAMTFAATAAILAACSAAPEMDEAMKQDLQAASAGTIEMAPRGPALRTVSAIEQHKPAQPTVTPVKRVVAPAKTPRPEIVQAAPTPEPRATAPAATAPSKTPDIRPAPPGGYKTMNDVIRNAPFPIKP